jgi:threonine/homoserine/homoserine lactone efflux protein
MHFGVRRSIPYITGIAVGLSSMAVASALGLAALLMALPALEISVRAIGTAYLLYLAWRVATGGAPSRTAQTARPVSFLGAAGLAWYNPKAWAVTMGASSSFAHLTTEMASQAALMGGTFLAFAAASMALWCMMGQALGRLLKTERQWHVINITMGSLLALSIIPMWVES